MTKTALYKFGISK